MAAAHAPASWYSRVGHLHPAPHPRAVLFGKLDTLLFTSLESATAFCKLRGNPYVELVHWLHQLMQQQDGDLQQVITHFSREKCVMTCCKPPSCCCIS